MLRKVLRTVVFALPLLAATIALTDGPTPDCFPCPPNDDLSAHVVVPQLP